MKRLSRIKTLLFGGRRSSARCFALAPGFRGATPFLSPDSPAAQWGQGLSALAASGRFGFALAFTLYAAVILLPLYALVRIAAQRS